MILLRSSSAQAIELGAEAAIDEINAAGGVLGGRPLKLVTRDNRSVPARGVQNLKELAAIPDLVAVLGGRFSPVIIEQLPLIEEHKLPFIALWSSADQITRNDMHPNYVFRVSLHDSLAMPFMLDQAAKRGLRRVGLLLSNTAWGRSNLAAADAHLRTSAGKGISIVRSSWFSWADTTLIGKYLGMVDAGAQAIIVVANDEAALLVREVAALPKSRRVPLILHWGVSGGEFAEKAGAALQEVDVSVLQTFSPQRADPDMRARFLKAASTQGVHRFEDIRATVGAAHAYDAVHLLAKAVAIAGSTDRSKVRAALEPILPSSGDHRDSVGNFVRQRFGREVHELLVDPLVGGIYAADTANFSLATVPQLADLSHGRSVLLTARRRRAAAVASGPVFETPRAGLGALTAALAWWAGHAGGAPNWPARSSSTPTPRPRACRTASAGGWASCS